MDLSVRLQHHDPIVEGIVEVLAAAVRRCASGKWRKAEGDSLQHIWPNGLTGLFHFFHGGRRVKVELCNLVGYSPLKLKLPKQGYLMILDMQVEIYQTFG